MDDNSTGGAALDGRLTGFYENLVIQQACHFKAGSYASNTAARHETMSVRGERKEYVTRPAREANRLRGHICTLIRLYAGAVPVLLDECPVG
jgi:hypothetical protein